MNLGGPARRPGRGEGNPRRDFKANAREFVDWFKENEAAGRPSYASVQPYHAYEEPLCIEKTFYDFDCKEDRERAGDDAHDFARRLRRFYGVEPLIAFSGNKGYHVYPFLEEPFRMGLSKPMLKAVYGWLQRMLLGNAKYETLDSSVHARAQIRLISGFHSGNYLIRLRALSLTTSISDSSRVTLCPLMPPLELITSRALMRCFLRGSYLSGWCSMLLSIG